jgi:hypothetical protein
VILLMKSLVCDICGKPYARGKKSWIDDYPSCYTGGTDYRIEIYKTRKQSGIFTIMDKLDVCQRCANKIRTFVEEDYLTKDEIKEIVDKEKVPNNNDDNFVWNNALTYIAKQFELAMKSKK